MIEIDLLDYINQRGLTKARAGAAFMILDQSKKTTITVRGPGWPTLPTYISNFTIIEVPDEED